MEQKRILFVFAHPDDETFTSGVIIAKYAREMACQISLLCATRGQAGRAGEPPLCTPEELPRVREQELRDAAAILGIMNVDVLDYEDKHLAEVPVDELIGQITSAIARYQPQIVITFAPHGISGHPDHLAISDATTRAVQQLAGHDSPVKKLYYATILTSHAFTGKAGRSIYSDPYEKITTIITAPEYRHLAAEALLAHKTQHLSVERVFPGIHSGDYSNVRITNYYILAWHNLANYTVTEKEHDLFLGIT